jgi:hypothetical protein
LEFSLSGDLTEVQRTATEFALELWSNELAGTVPVDVCVNFHELADGVIGQSFPQPPLCNDENDTWYPPALWNQLVGYHASGADDVFLEMNSKFGFYLGLDGNTTSIDYVTIMLHETCHGLGFGSGCSQEGFFYYGAPVIYDRMLYQGLTGPCWTELSDNERAALIISNNLYAGGTQLLEANEGVRVKIYAPYHYSGGSSVHHWANEINFPSFMKYAYDYPLHTFNTRKIGMMMDMGWTVPEIDPNAVFVNFHANGGTGHRPPQPFLPGEAQALSMNPFGNTGYSFINWNTEPDGSGDSYEDKETITISADLNLYAQWKGNEYRLGFYPFGGTVNPESKQVIYGQSIGELPIPKKNGYIFNGWRLGNQFINEDFIWKYVANLNAMAQWAVGISENEKQSFEIIPNPAHHTFELKMENGEWRIDHVELFDVYGRKLSSHHQITSSSNQQIDISNLPAGIYFVKIITEVGTQTQKLIKL